MCAGGQTRCANFSLRLLTLYRLLIIQLQESGKAALLAMQSGHVLRCRLPESALELAQTRVQTSGC